jgi:hypothetical protein
MKNNLSNLTPKERLAMCQYDYYQEQNELKETLYFELLKKDKLNINEDKNDRSSQTK